MAQSMFTIEMRGDRDLVVKYLTMSDRLHARLLQLTQSLALELQARVQQKHLSGPTGEHTLSVGKNTDGHTGGALRRSVFQRVTDSSIGPSGKVGYSADVIYAAIHEFGGDINIPEIVPVKAKALHFVMNGKDVFLKRVAAHTVHMPERAPLRTSLSEMAQEITERYRMAALSELK